MHAKAVVVEHARTTANLRRAFVFGHISLGLNAPRFGAANVRAIGLPYIYMTPLSCNGHPSVSTLFLS